MSDKEQEIYTDAPKQWDNLFLGSFQLLGWLFFKPSAWRNHVKRVAPDLNFDFCLAEITLAKWRETSLWRIFIQGYLILPLFSIALIGLFLRLWHDGETVSTAFIIAGSFGFSVACSLAFGVVSGTAAGAAGSFFFAILGAVIFYQPELNYFSIAVWCFIVGMVANIIMTLPSEKFDLTHFAGGVAIGVFVGLFGTVFLVSIPLTIVGLTETAHFAIAILALLSFIMIAIACPFKENKFYLVVGAFVVSYGSLAFTALGMVGGLAKGLVYGTVIGACLAIPYITTHRWLKDNSIIASGAVASALVIALLWGFVSGYLYYDKAIILEEETTLWLAVKTMFPFLVIGVLSALFGLTFSWWRGMILWPFLIIWHTLIYLIEKRNVIQSSLLPYHAAFWDEHQRLQLVGLSEHILLTTDKNPREAQKAIDYLERRVHQRWAIKQAKLIIESPYIFANPLDLGKENFVGRNHLADELQNLLFQVHCSVFLYGVYRIGKTSLLKNLSGLLKEPQTVVALLVDLQGAVSLGKDISSFFDEIAHQMTRYAKQHYHLSLPPAQINHEDKPCKNFDRWLDKVQALIGSRTLLLMLDEFAKLDEAICEHKSDFSEDILDAMRHWIQHREHFQIIITSQGLPEFRRWPSLANNMTPKYLGYLTETEACELIEHPIEEFKLQYQPEATQLILKLTHCHPALIQLLCREIVELKNKHNLERRFFVKKQEVEEAIPTALKTGQSIFVTFELRATEVGNALLRYIATLGTGTKVKKEQLAQQCQGDLEKTLEILQDLELLKQDDGAYWFRIEMFRLWYAEKTG